MGADRQYFLRRCPWSRRDRAPLQCIEGGRRGIDAGFAARLVKEGITVNAVAPSLIETDMLKGQETLVSRIPLGRFGQADEVAKAVMMLVDNPCMTGQTVAMSGGMAFN